MTSGGRYLDAHGVHSPKTTSHRAIARKRTYRLAAIPRVVLTDAPRAAEYSRAGSHSWFCISDYFTHPFTTQ